MHADPALWPNLQRGQGQPVLMLHGFLGNKEDWRPVMERLSDHYRCIAVDLPGHGHHQPTTIPDFSSLLMQLEQQCSALQVERVHLVGYSMGGRLAWHLSRLFPHRIASLTLLSTSPGMEDEETRASRREADGRWADLLREQTRDDFLSAWYGQPVFQSLSSKPDLLAALIKQRTAGSAELLAQALVAWGQGTIPSMWNRLHEVTCPVAMMIGETDTAYVAIGTRLKDLLPDARIVIVPRAGHTLLAEQPQAVAEALEDFLNDRK